MNLFITIISSTLVSVIVTFFLNIYNKNIEYKREYYKQLIEKRIKAFDSIENLIQYLRLVLIDKNEKKPYHIIFNSIEDLENINTKLMLCFCNGIWLDEEINESLEKLNEILTNITNKYTTSEELIKVGLVRYDQIATMREEIEAKCKKSYLNLHKMNRFGVVNTRKKRYFFVENY